MIDQNYSIDEILMAVNEIQNKKKGDYEKTKKFHQIMENKKKDTEQKIIQMRKTI